MMGRFLHLLVLTTLFLSLSCAVVQAGWVERSDVPCAGGGAFHTLGVELAGDLNSDGQITSADAIIALRMVVNGEHNDDADMDCDGQVTSVDALMILQGATAAPETITLSGTGQKATSKFSLEQGLSIFRMTHDGDGHFGVVLLNAEGDYIDLLANGIGEFDGSKAVGISESGIYLLDISANGGWTTTIEQPRPSQAPPVPKTLNGTGQEASEMFYLDKGLVTFELTHDGDGYFGVWLLNAEGDKTDLLANEIGEFEGSKAVGVSESGIYLLDINANGNWEISIE